MKCFYCGLLWAVLLCANQRLASAFAPAPKHTYRAAVSSKAVDHVDSKDPTGELEQTLRYLNDEERQLLDEADGKVVKCRLYFVIRVAEPAVYRVRVRCRASGNHQIFVHAPYNPRFRLLDLREIKDFHTLNLHLEARESLYLILNCTRGCLEIDEVVVEKKSTVEPQQELGPPVADREVTKEMHAVHRVAQKATAENSQRLNNPQVEGYNVKRLPNGTLVKHGTYVVVGPNGELQVEGQYIDGKKSGKWKRRLPSQELQELWIDGKLVKTTVLAQPSVYVIDFKAGVPHTKHIPAGLGSTTYVVLGKEGEMCRIKYSIEIEMGVGPWIECLVPCDVGKIVFQNTNEGIDFSSLDKYRVDSAKTQP